jgi:shikimate kinase
MTLSGDPRRVLLVGFMAAGKSTVGPILARDLGWRFVDLDECVEEEEGCSIAEVFRLRGEAHFREVEDRLTRGMLQEDRVVLGSGGGWAAHPGRLHDLPDGTRSVWLRVSPEEAVRRSGDQPGERPLLRGPDPLQEAHDLLAAREVQYVDADLEVDTEGRTPEDVTAYIVAWVTRHKAKSPAVET